MRIIPLYIIQKGLAFGCERSGTVTVPGASSTSASCPAGRMAMVLAGVVRKRLKPKLGSTKANDIGVYQIARGDRGKPPLASSNAGRPEP